MRLEKNVIGMRWDRDKRIGIGNRNVGTKMRGKG
jgi:hypothetical protein